MEFQVVSLYFDSLSGFMRLLIQFSEYSEGSEEFLPCPLISHHHKVIYFYKKTVIIVA